MHPRAAEFVRQAREAHGIEVDVHEFPEGTKTAADAAEAIGCEIGQIGSSLVFLADGEPVVVVTSGANRVSEERLADLVGAESVRLAGPEEVREATGWSIGGVPAFCHAGPLPVYFDETLLGFEEVWTAAGTPAVVFPVDPAELVSLAGATVARVAE